MRHFQSVQKKRCNCMFGKTLKWVEQLILLIALQKKGWFGYNEFSTDWSVAGNIPDRQRQGHNFVGIPSDSGYQIRATCNISASTDAGGTVYK